MQQISDALIGRYFDQGEDEVTTERPFLVNRISFVTSFGVGVFVLPDNCLAIKRVTWKGWKLSPLPHRMYREAFNGSGGQIGRPYWYIYNNVGLRTIQVFPVCNEALTTGTHLWTTDIPNKFIVEYYQSTDHNVKVLPDFIRRQLLKIYVALKISSMEGNTQSVLMTKYFQSKWQIKKQEWYHLLNVLYSVPRQLILSQNDPGTNYSVGNPVLPINKFGISVDDEY